MKITDLETICVSIPNERPVRFATRSVSKRDYTIVKVTTDDALEGFGIVGVA